MITFIVVVLSRCCFEWEVLPTLLVLVLVVGCLNFGLLCWCLQLWYLCLFLFWCFIKLLSLYLVGYRCLIWLVDLLLWLCCFWVFGVFIMYFACELCVAWLCMIAFNVLLLIDIGFDCVFVYWVVIILCFTTCFLWFWILYLNFVLEWGLMTL